MKFVRRNDLDCPTRLQLAAAMSLRGFGDWGLVTEMAGKYGVSRQFLYDNEALLMRASAAESAARTDFSSELVHKLIICLRLHCNGSLEGISRTLAEMGLSPCSTGHVSQFLHAAAESCSLAVPHKGAPVILLPDEIFTNGRPVFVVLEALSHCILDIILMPDRKADTWKGVLTRLQAAGVDIGLPVKDQGRSLKAAAMALELPERADLFHLLKPFDPYLPSLESHAYGAIKEEFERLRVFGNRKCEESLARSLVKYEAASMEATRAMRASDNYDYLHMCLHESFDSFTADGRLRTRATAEGDIEAALRLMEEEFPRHNGILDAVRFLRENLSDYRNYFEQLERIVRCQAKRIPEHALRAGCLSWQLARKAMACKCPRLKKKLSLRSSSQMEFAIAGAGGSLKTDINSLFSELDSNVRSSSPLEAINSIIGSHLNACRGQINQQSLTMLAFFLNHRRANRGKYAGSSPYERLTGIREANSPVEQILKLAAGNTGWKPEKSTKPFPKSFLKAS